MGTERAVYAPSKSINVCPCERQHIEVAPKHCRPYSKSFNQAAVGLAKDKPIQSLEGVLKWFQQNAR